MAALLEVLVYHVAAVRHVHLETEIARGAVLRHNGAACLLLEVRLGDVQVHLRLDRCGDTELGIAWNVGQAWMATKLGINRTGERPKTDTIRYDVIYQRQKTPQFSDTSN